MNHSADIGLIYPHPKGASTDNKLNLTTLPSIFNGTAFVGTQPRVVSSGLEATFPQPSSQFLAVSPSSHID